MSPTPIDEQGIRDRLDELSKALDRIHETLKVENAKRDKRIRSNQLAITAAIAVAAVGVIVGAFGVKEVHEANDRTVEARIASCQQYNTQQKQAIASDIAQSHAFVAALTQGSTDPDVAQRAAEFNAHQDALIREGRPLRDCSAKGIEKYLGRQATQ